MPLNPIFDRSDWVKSPVWGFTPPPTPKRMPATGIKWISPGLVPKIRTNPPRVDDFTSAFAAYMDTLRSMTGKTEALEKEKPVYPEIEALHELLAVLGIDNPVVIE